MIREFAGYATCPSLPFMLRKQGQIFFSAQATNRDATLTTPIAGRVAGYLHHLRELAKATQHLLTLTSGVDVLKIERRNPELDCRIPLSNVFLQKSNWRNQAFTTLRRPKSFELAPASVRWVTLPLPS